MSRIYINFWLKNGEKICVYVETNQKEEIILQKLVSTKTDYLEARLNYNGNLIAFKKDEIACIEIKGKCCDFKEE